MSRECGQGRSDRCRRMLMLPSFDNVWDLIQRLGTWALGSFAGAGLTVLALKTWLSERIKGSIKAEYDERIETLKAQLKNQYDEKLETLKAQLKSQSDIEIEQVKRGSLGGWVKEGRRGTF